MRKVHFPLPETDSCHFCERLAAGESHGLVAKSTHTATLVNTRQHQEVQVFVIPKRPPGFPVRR